MHRVQKLLSNYGYCSRRKAEELIEEGRVNVNGKVVKLGDKATGEDQIYVDGKLLGKERKRYLMFNKPVNCVTALRDKHCRTIMHYVKIKERVFPIGRLDRYTSGLLLLTNDGDFANKVMHPRYEINKTYIAVVDKSVDKNSIKIIQKGMRLEDGKTKPARVKQLGDKKLEITIHEGKNRIVRRMLEELGYKVVALQRIKIGNLLMRKLGLGCYRDLTDMDKKRIFKNDRV